MVSPRPHVIQSRRRRHLYLARRRHDRLLPKLKIGTRQGFLLRRENVTQAVQKQFEQTRAIDAQLLGNMQARWPLPFSGELGQYENVLRNTEWAFLSPFALTEIG